MILHVLFWLATLFIAFLAGKVVSKLKLPAILGWLITGIICATLEGGGESELAVIVKGTIAAAAVINEIIAVIMAKKGFEKAGEIKKGLSKEK